MRILVCEGAKGAPSIVWGSAMFVFGNLSAVMNTINPCKKHQTERLRVRRILHANRNTCEPLQVVVMPNGHMFLVSDYMAALTFEDSGATVWGVWRDNVCMWHVVKQ